MNATLDLFDAPLVAGLSLRNDFLSATNETDLIAHLDAESLSPFKFQQWTGKRLTRSYGWSYDFESGSFAPAEVIPDWLQTVKARAAQFAGLQPGDLVQALLIRYDPGAGIGWHKDRPVFEHVVGISLGYAATLRLRRRTAAGFERAKAEGDLPAHIDSEGLMRVLIAMLQGISVQANQGATREELERLVESGLALWPSA